MDFDFMTIIIFGAICATIMGFYAVPKKLDDENAKRAAKGKSILTEEEYWKKIDKERLIGTLILVSALFISMTIIYNAG